MWASDSGGVQPQRSMGRLNSERAFEGVTHLTVDTMQVQEIAGIQVQV